jgi:hypothetical protein
MNEQPGAESGNSIKRRELTVVADSRRVSRHWYRLHPSTYVILLLAAGLLFLLNVPGQPTAQFGVYPYEPWRKHAPSPNVARAFDAKHIRTDHLLVHGWPATWLVRETRWYRAPTIRRWRETRIWSFSEDLRHFYPGWLTLDILVGLTLLAAVGFTFERWRRRRRHLGQQTTRDWLGFIAVLGIALAVGLKTARDYRIERAALNAVAPGFDSILRGLYEAQGEVYLTSGGPIGLRDLFGRRWFERTIQLDVPAKHLQHLASLPHLRALRLQQVHFGDPQVSVLGGLKRLELLWLEGVVPTSPAVQNNNGSNDDKSLAQLLDHLKGLTRLEVLRLDHFAFGDQSARALAAHDRLRILVVNDATALTNEGLAALAGCKNLEVLDLHVGKETTSAGVELLKRLPHLRILKLNGSSSPDRSAIDALKRIH